MDSRVEQGILYLIPGTDMVADKFDEMRNFFLNALETDNEPNVVLDVKGVKVVDSLGVNLIIGLYKELNKSSRTFKIVNACDKFMKVAHFFKFNSLFDIVHE